MIINHPVLNRFSPSIREVIPQTGDDSLLIANQLALTALPPEPCIITGAATSPQESSFATGTSATIANAAQSQITLCSLRQGYWSIRVAGCYIANYLSILQGGDLQIILSNGLQNYQPITLYASGGVQSFDTEFEIMLPDLHVLSFLLNTNGVGNSHAASVHVLGNKLL